MQFVLNCQNAGAVFVNEKKLSTAFSHEKCPTQTMTNQLGARAGIFTGRVHCFSM